MAEQRALRLEVGRLSAGDLRFTVARPINWRKLERLARRIAAGLATQATTRDGFALRRYAEQAALLEQLRGQLAAKPLKQAARKQGRRLRVKAPVLFAASREGRKLHALVDQLEERLVAREGRALCG